MANPLPIDERLETGAQLVLRARIFYDIWRFFEGDETRPAIIDTMRRYSEFFRYDPHAHFFSFIVHMAALLEARQDTINLPNLAKEFQDSGLIEAAVATEVDALLEQAVPFKSKVAFIRNNLFAHRSASLPYAEVFKKAGVTANELRELTEIALKIVNRLLISRGFTCHVFDRLPLSCAEAMLKALSEHASENFDDG